MLFVFKGAGEFSFLFLFHVERRLLQLFFYILYIIKLRLRVKEEIKI